MSRKSTYTTYLRRRIASRSSRPSIRHEEQRPGYAERPSVIAAVRKQTLVQLRGLCLVCDSGGSSRSSLRVAEVGMVDRFEVLVELIHERDARRDVQVDDVVIADAVEVLHESADRVAMSDDDNLPTGLHRRRDRLFPVRDEPGDGVLETLGQRQVVFGHISIARIMSRPAIVCLEQSGRLRAVAAAPQFDLW